MDRIDFNQNSEPEPPTAAQIEVSVDRESLEELAESTGILAGAVETLSDSVDSLSEVSEEMTGNVEEHRRSLDRLREMVAETTMAARVLVGVAAMIVGVLFGGLVVMGLMR